MSRKTSQLSADNFRPQAEGAVTLGLIVNEIARCTSSPKPDQVRAMIEEQAQTLRAARAVVRWYYEEPGGLNEFEALAVEENVVEWALQALASRTGDDFTGTNGPRR